MENKLSKMTQQIFDAEFELKRKYLFNNDLFIENIDKTKSSLVVQDMTKEEVIKKIRLFKVIKFVYDKDTKIIDKLSSVFSALHSIGTSYLLQINSNGNQCEFMIGIKSESHKTNRSTNLLKGIIDANFPGTKFENDTPMRNDEVLSANAKMYNKNSEISTVIGIPSLKDKEEKQFIQGIENLINGMEGKEFSALFIADPVGVDEIEQEISKLEANYNALSYYKNVVTSRNKNESLSLNKGFNVSKSHGVNDSTSNTINEGWSDSKTKGSSISKSVNNSNSQTVTDTKSINKSNGISKKDKTQSKGYSTSNAKGSSRTYSEGTSNSDSKSTTQTYNKGRSSTNTTGTSTTDQVGFNEGYGLTQGISDTVQLTTTDIRVSKFLDDIEKQIDRLNNGKSVGFWKMGAFFFSNKPENSSIAANIYSGTTSGEESYFEASNVITYNNITNPEEKDKVLDYLKRYEIPRLSGSDLLASNINTNELVISMNFPHKSVRGLDVVESVAFGNNPSKQTSNTINIGKLYNYEKVSSTDILLDYNKFSSHIFVTGSTGSGKSNVTYNLIDKLTKKGIKFLVIEPTKGEYKTEFGNRKDVHVFGTNPNLTKLLKINPFEFPEGITITEHIERLIDILNACWPMEAAMPDILKQAIEHCYESKGWLFTESRCIYDENRFPDFFDLLESLTYVVEGSSFGKELEDNYKGSLLARVKSLTNGIYKEIFNSTEDENIPNKTLFDENVIIDISRVPSTNTISLFMGIIIMKLTEYRMVKKEGSNSDLKHVTILEEAHNLLRRTSSDSSAGSSNLAGKSVEMISNVIAEMRTYGEGFIIADQAPGMLDMSVIRNTNTKICLRLPDLEDRKLVGSAMNLTDQQIKQLAQLETGVAAIYQNDWQEAILCKFDKFESSASEYTYKEKEGYTDEYLSELVKKIRECIETKEDKLSEKETKAINQIFNIIFIEKQILNRDFSKRINNLKMEFEKIVKNTIQYDIDHSIVLKYILRVAYSHANDENIKTKLKEVYNRLLIKF